MFAVAPPIFSSSSNIAARLPKIAHKNCRSAVSKKCRTNITQISLAYVLFLLTALKLELQSSIRITYTQFTLSP